MPKQSKNKDDLQYLFNKLSPADIPVELEQRVLAAVHEQQQTAAVWELWRHRAIKISSLAAVISLWLFAYNLGKSEFEEMLTTVTLNPDVIPALGTDLLLGLLEILPMGSFVTTIVTLSLITTLRAIKITSHDFHSSAVA